MKIFILLISLTIFIFAKDISPAVSIKVDGGVKDMILSGDNLIVGTDSGKLEVYNLKEKKITKKIQLPDIKDFMGDTIHTRVASLDYLDGRYAFLSDSGIGGYTNVWLNENNQTKKIITHKDKKMIVKLKFIDKDHLLFGFLGNEVSLYDIPNKKYIYTKQLSESKFSDFALNKDRTKAAFANESGINYIIDTKTGKVLKTLKGQNLDNVFAIDFKKDFVVCAGKDRRGAYYNLLTDSNGYFKGNFFIYATALSPSDKKVAFAMDEDNSISIYDLFSKENLARLKGLESKVNKIIFKDENTIIAAGDDNTILIWKLNKKGKK